MPQGPKSGTLVLATVGFVAFVQSNPAAANDGSVENGRTLAEAHCAACHGIENDDPMGTYPPSFDAIARFRPPEQIPGRIWYPPTHAVMPSMVNLLNSEDVADLTAYITSLMRANLDRLTIRGSLVPTRSEHLLHSCQRSRRESSRASTATKPSKI